MTDISFTYKTEYFPKNPPDSPFLSFQPHILSILSPKSSNHLTKKHKEAPIFEGIPKNERQLRNKKKALARFSQRFTESDLFGKEHAIEFLHQKYRKGHKGNTIRCSGSIIYSFMTFIQTARGITVDRVTKADIEAYVEHYQDKGASATSIKGKLSALYPFMSFLVDKEVINSSILSSKVKVKLPEPLPRSMSNEDVDKLLMVLDDVRDKAMVLLMLRTGMRIGELLELQISDINFQDKKITIYLGEKNDQGRVVYFSDDASDALKDWLAVRNPERKFLFYGPRHSTLSYVAAWYRISDCLKKAGLSHKKYSPHCFRHTFATEFLNAGMRLEVLQELLGHKKIEMTRLYARLSDCTREAEYFKAMDKIEKGGCCDDHSRCSNKLQAAFEKKEFFTTHD